MAKQVNTSNFLAKPKVKRPGVHAKSNSFSNQTRLPAELKHITKRRKRN